QPSPLWPCPVPGTGHGSIGHGRHERTVVHPEAPASTFGTEPRETALCRGGVPSGASKSEGLASYFQMSSTPDVAWSFALPSGKTMRPSVAIGVFQCPL